MRNLLSLAAALGLTLGVMAGSFAADKAAPPPKAHKAAAKKCPACGMALSTKKTKDTPQAIKVGNTTYYCCAACDMNKKKSGGSASKDKGKTPS
jgi:hypothetical protein